MKKYFEYIDYEGVKFGGKIEEGTKFNVEYSDGKILNCEILNFVDDGADVKTEEGVRFWCYFELAEALYCCNTLTEKE